MIPSVLSFQVCRRFDVSLATLDPSCKRKIRKRREKNSILLLLVDILKRKTSGSLNSLSLAFKLVRVRHHFGFY